eukprot:1036748-Pyramimonas_sp.AAC.1
MGERPDRWWEAHANLTGYYWQSYVVLMLSAAWGGPAISSSPWCTMSPATSATIKNGSHAI